MPNIPNPEELYFNNIWKLKGNPFRNISAEDISENDILNIFVFNDDLYLDVFDIKNSVIRGEKGTGKTMLLKAIYSFYNYKLLIDFNKSNRISCIPIFINLSLYNQINDDNELYRRIILAIIEEMINFHKIIDKIQFNESWFDKFVKWIKDFFIDNPEIQEEYENLSAESVKEIFSKKNVLSAQLSTEIASISAQIEEYYQRELVKDKFIGVSNIKKIFDRYLSDYADNILILFDEVSSLDKAFFQGNNEDNSTYIKLINQLRTTSNIYYKMAIYPHHYSDQLEESRYGNSINLQLDVYNPDQLPFNRKLIKRTIESYIKSYSISGNSYDNISSYIEVSSIDDNNYEGSEMGNDSNNCGDAIEQIIFGSRGTYRRIIQICSTSFTLAAKKHLESSELKVTKEIVLEALSDYGKNLYNKFNPNEQQEISNIAKICRKRTRSRFTYPYGTNYLSKFLQKGVQDNIIYLMQAGLGRSASVFEFDYAYCVNSNLTTHLLKHVERAANSRSLTNGNFLTKTAKIDIDALNDADKYFGRINHINEKRGFGFITCNENIQGIENNSIFFHTTEFLHGNLLKKYNRKEVEFTLIEGKKGLEASNVKIVQ